MRQAFVARLRIVLSLVCGIALMSSVVPTASADPYPDPPLWNGGTGPAVHYPPVAWPSDATWVPYTSQSSDINDPRTQDPSNGGTSPQNYANVSSSCIDKGAPSIFWQYDPAGQTIFFRWRVEQIANTYATGPSAGSFSSSDPWTSALWTVLIDTNGDGYRDFAAHLDGSSGSPSAPVDRLVGIYGTSRSQSIDYVGDPSIHMLGHNPTAFVDGATSKILNFGTGLTPTTSWPNGSAERTWNYGTTRATNLSNSSCTEYLIDYQIPLGILDATGVGGPRITPTTPLSFMFATSNSLNNPMQKDAVLNGDYIADPTKPAPFGDTITLAGGPSDQPIVQSVSATGCGPATLTAQVADAIKFVGSTPQTTVSAVDFYSYADTNGNGVADDGGGWSFAVSGSTTNSPVGQWRASWNSAALPRGQYLIGVKATDAQGHITWSYLTQAAVGASPPNYANPAPAPGIVVATFVNTCGTPPPSLAKAASPSQVVAGATTQFTITVNNTASAPLTVSSVADALPPGFSYVSTDGGTLGAPTATPTSGATGTVTWSFPAVAVAAHSTATLVFTARASTVVGTYSNVATATTSIGDLVNPPAQVAVGAPRLTIAKQANVASANPGDNVTYTITYSNDSPVAVTSAVITDQLPTGLAFVSATGGGTYDLPTRTVSWAVGAIGSGEGPFSVSFTAAVANPYPTAAAVPLVNTATIASNESSPASASASTYIAAPRPRLTIQKDSATSQVGAGGQATFTLAYANSGNAAATGVVLTDTLPAGFTFVSATNGGTHSAGVVTWNLGTVAIGATGTVSVVLQAATPFTQTNPATNTAAIRSDQTVTVTDTFAIGVTQTGSICSNYYFRSATTNVGFDGTQRIANTTAPTGATASTVSFNATTTAVEAVRFYADPATTSDVTFAGTLSTNFYIDKVNGPQLKIDAYVYDYNPTTGARTLIGSTNFNSTGSGTNQLYTFTVNTSGVLQKGHRLLWKFDAYSNNNTTFTFRFDGTASPSGANFCVTPPANLTINKEVNNLSVSPGGTLAYTLRFANIGQTNATGATIVETLPAGVSYVGATLNGSATTPASSSGQQYTFNLRSTDTATVGQVTGGQGGTLVINVAVAQPLSSAIRTLTNTASIQSNQTSPVTDSRTTDVVLPDVSIAKAADKTLLLPGDVVTYSLTALNSGVGTATNVTVADALPATAYFTFVPGSVHLNGAAVTPDPVAGNNLSVAVGSLATGASAVVTFQMQVAAVGAPAGVTPIANTATVSDAQTSGTRTSTPVTVAISTNPNLRLVKSAAPAFPAPGGLVVYTLTISNVGSGDALDVLLRDPIPGSTHYAAGTLTDGGTSKTDLDDGDSASFDPAANEVAFALGTIPGGTSRTVEFAVRVDTPLSAGTTPINNTATVTASNSAGKTGSAAVSTTATPALTLTKSAPTTLAFPLTTLAAAASSATVTVVDAARIAVPDVVVIGGTAATVMAISGNTLTLDTAVSAAAGAPVLPTYEYVLSYANTGSAAATAVVLQDALVAGLAFVSASDGGTASGGVVTWSLGVVEAGAVGSVRVRVRPTAASTYANTATIDSFETAPVASNTTTTDVGGIELAKSTSTPLVTNYATGVQATYTITLHNQLASPAAGVSVADVLPAGFTYRSTTSVSGQATRTTTADPTPGSATPTWSTWTIAAQGTLVITFVADIAPTVGAATYQNAVTASSSSAVVLPFDALATTDDDVTVELPENPVLAATKGWAMERDADENGVVSGGDTVRYTVVITHTGGPDALEVNFSDTPDANTALDAGSVTTTQGSITTGNTPGDTTVFVALGALGFGQSATITFDVVVADPLPVGTTQLANQGIVTVPDVLLLATDDPTTPAPGDPTLTPVGAAPDLELTVTPDVASATPGSAIDYALDYINAGTAQADGVVLTETVPTGTTFDPAASTAGWVCVPDTSAGSTCTLAVGSLAPADTGTAHFVVVVDATAAAGVTTVDDAASIADDGANGADPTPANNADSATTPLVAAPYLVVSKSDGISAAAPGATLTYAVTVANQGNQDATGVMITDTLPPNTTLVSATGGGTITAPPSGLSWPIISLAAGANVSYTVVVTVDVAIPAGVTSISNTATATDDGTNGVDPRPAANSATDTDAVVRPDLQVTATDNGVSADLGGSVLYTLDYTNAGAYDASGVVLTVAVPANTTFDPAASTAGWVCAPDTSAGSACTFALGAVPSGQSGTVDFAVTVANTIPSSTTELSNTVTIADDGTHGADPTPANNVATEPTPFSPTGITLTSFSAVRKAHTVELYWTTSAELSTSGFRLYRSTDRDVGHATLLTPTMIDAQGRTEGAAYQYTDAAVSDGMLYYYWLEEVATNNQTELFGPAAAGSATRVFLSLVGN